MKKLTILLMVVGIAALAQAVPTEKLTWTDGIVTWTLDIANAKVYGDGGSAAAYTSSYIKQSEPNFGRLDPTPVGSLTGGYKDGTYNAAGDLGSFKDPYAGNATYGGIYYLAEAGDLDPCAAPNQAVGRWFEADVTFGVDDWFQMMYVDGTEFKVALCGQVPEPATVALLGLGGLFLRKRRRT